jgi:hypothetical protein
MKEINLIPSFVLGGKGRGKNDPSLIYAFFAKRQKKPALDSEGGSY